MKLIYLIMTAWCLTGTCMGYGQPKQEVLTNKSIVDLTKAGLGKEVIVSQIDASACKFDMATGSIITLKKAGVPEEVINAMIHKGNSRTEAPPKEVPGPGVEARKEAKDNFPVVDLVNHLYYYNKSRQAVKPLEKAVAGLRTRQTMFGANVLLQVDGDKSSVRLSAEEAPTFIINTGGPALPEVVLYRLKSGKGKREVASMKVNPFSGMKTGEDVLTVDITKLKDGLYQVSANKKMGKGEYFFTGKPVAGANSMDAFTFGVD